MRRLVGFVIVMTLVPATAASAGLDDLLERSREASYTAEQIISCSSPDGVRDAVVRIEQSGGEIRLGSSASNGVEVATGLGGWAVTRAGSVVSSAAVVSEDDQVEAPLYTLEEVGNVTVLGRAATSHQLSRDAVLRAELVFDDETGAMLAATTYSGLGTPYCERRFVSFDPIDPGFEPLVTSDLGEPQESVEIDTDLPGAVEGFDRLDLYEDAEGFRFAYYSDGFFSFAVFETPTRVELPEGATVIFNNGSYQRSFTAGQATYVWETPAGGMALVGDLPPDLHEAVLSGLPASQEPGLLTRWWRRLFG